MYVRKNGLDFALFFAMFAKGFAICLKKIAANLATGNTPTTILEPRRAVPPQITSCIKNEIITVD